MYVCVCTTRIIIAMMFEIKTSVPGEANYRTPTENSFGHIGNDRFATAESISYRYEPSSRRSGTVSVRSPSLFRKSRFARHIVRGTRNVRTHATVREALAGPRKSVENARIPEYVRRLAYNNATIQCRLKISRVIFTHLTVVSRARISAPLD